MVDIFSPCENAVALACEGFEKTILRKIRIEFGRETTKEEKDIDFADSAPSWARIFARDIFLPREN